MLGHGVFHLLLEMKAVSMSEVQCYQAKNFHNRAAKDGYRCVLLPDRRISSTFLGWYAKSFIQSCM